MGDNSINWGWEITTSWKQQLSSILHTGALLCQAKAALPRGEWLKLLSSGLPFKERTAQRLMRISKDARLANPAHGPHLPPCWRTLYVLTTLSNAQFTMALEEGTINPEMQRADAEYIGKLSIRGESKKAAEPNHLIAKRNAYLEACQNLSDVKRETEIRIITTALTESSSEKLRRRLAKQRSAEQTKISLVKKIILLKERQR